jgi:EAL domain-containing protein (putative c-di-GMP-specific phosphodiesterase class I)
MIRDLGISISLDDFGTGYSSLSHLRRFPINYLKIDRSFVDEVLTNVDDRAIVSAIIGMAQNLGLQVVAEGVETLEQANFLREKGCDFAQGYFYGRPMSAENILTHLRSEFSGAALARAT